MTLVQKAVAARNRVQPVFRIHEPPRPESLDRLKRVIDALMKVHELDPCEYAWRRRGEKKESISDYLERMRATGTEVSVGRRYRHQKRWNG